MYFTFRRFFFMSRIWSTRMFCFFIGRTFFIVLSVRLLASVFLLFGEIFSFRSTVATKALIAFKFSATVCTLLGEATKWAESNIANFLVTISAYVLQFVSTPHEFNI